MKERFWKSHLRVALHLSGPQCSHTLAQASPLLAPHPTRLDSAEKARRSPRLMTVGEQASAETDRRERGEHHAGSGQQTAVFLLDRGPHLVVDQLGERIVGGLQSSTLAM